MAAFLFSLGSALCFGAGDFAGGFAARRTSALQVAAVSQWTGLLLLAPAFALFGSDPTAAGLGWGAASGASTGLGLILLFRALSAGAMALGAAMAGIFTTAVPVVFGLATGDRPPPLALAGLVLSMASIPPIVWQGPASRAEVSRRVSRAAWRRPGVADGVFAGIALGSTSIFFAETTTADGLWPVLSAQAASVLLLSVVTLGSRIGLVPPAGTRLSIPAVGVLHLVGVIFMVAALQRGLLALVAVVQSLYPAVTITLAWVVLRERLNPVRLVGLAAAGVGVTLIGIA